MVNNPPSQVEEFIPISFDSTYDVTYYYEDQSIQLYDVTSEVYHTLPWFKFEALVKSYYSSKGPSVIDHIINAVLNFRKVRLIPSHAAAGIKPIGFPDFNQLTMQILMDTAGLTFDDPEKERQFYIQKYGIEVLR